MRKKRKPAEEPAALPARPLAEIEAEIAENVERARRYSYADPRWGPLHRFINELLDEWQTTKGQQ